MFDDILGKKGQEEIDAGYCKLCGGSMEVYGDECYCRNFDCRRYEINIKEITRGGWELVDGE
jgi:hypothetical protein